MGCVGTEHRRGHGDHKSEGGLVTLCKRSFQVGVPVTDRNLLVWRVTGGGA